MDRSDLLHRLKNGASQMLVVGGGITGASVARDAAMRGLRVALVEREDFASATSSRSSKLIHGGLRYLEQMHFGLVFEATHERRVLSRIAPHLVYPMPFLFPIYRGDPHGRLKISAGMWLYDILASFRVYRRHQMIKPEAVAEAEPQLRREELSAAALYYDASTQDALLTLNTVSAAAIHGAVCANRVAYEGAVLDGDRVVGARLRDAETGESFQVEAGCIVHAAGPFTDEVQALSGIAGSRLLRPTKGTHIVVPRARLPVRHAVVMNARRDGRVTFAIPWGPATMIGTTDTDHDGDLGSIHATADDVAYLLETLDHYFPEAGVGPKDVISTWAGLRPLIRQGDASAYETSREHEVYWDPKGLLTICGGKLTTCRKMAEEVVDRYLKEQPAELRHKLRPCATAITALPGGEDLDGPEALKDLEATVEERTGLDRDRAQHLARTFGSRILELLEGPLGEPGALDPIVAGLPWVWGEVELAVRTGFARRTADVLCRRTLVFYAASDQGLGVAPKVAAKIGGLLGRSAAEIDADLDAYRAEVAASRAWRSETPAEREAP